MEEYRIRAENGEAVRFLYIHALHEKNSWLRTVDLPVCKINFFVSGKSTILINGVPYSTGEGDVLLYRPHELHYGRIPYVQNIEYYELLIPPEAWKDVRGWRELMEPFADRPADSFPSVQICTDPETRRELHAGFEELRGLLRGELECGEILAFSCLIRLLTLLRDARRRALRPAPSVPYPRPLVSALGYVHGHLSGELTNDAVARAGNVSAVYLCRLFRRYLGCTPGEYVLRCRLQAAKGLLAEGRSVASAGGAVGFRDPSAFSRAFRRAEGITPSAYAAGKRASAEQ